MTAPGRLRRKRRAGAIAWLLSGYLRATDADGQRTSPNAYVFVTANGTPQSLLNAHRWVVMAVVEAADERLVGAGGAPLPSGVTPDKLRHTFASLLTPMGHWRDPATVQEQLGMPTLDSR